MEKTAQFNSPAYMPEKPDTGNEYAENFFRVCKKAERFRKHCEEKSILSCIDSSPVTVTVLDRETYFASCTASIYMDGKLAVRAGADEIITQPGDARLQQLSIHAIEKALALAGFYGIPSDVDETEEKNTVICKSTAEKNEIEPDTQLEKAIRKSKEKLRLYSFDEVMDTVIPVGEFKGSTVRKLMATATAQNEEDVFTKLLYFVSDDFDVTVPDDSTTLEERVMFKAVMVRVKKVIESFREESQMDMLDSVVPVGDFKGKSIRQMLSTYPEGMKALEFYSGRGFDERKAIKENQDVKPSEILQFKFRMFRINGFFTMEENREGLKEYEQISVN